ncbi:MAG: phage shock protein PspA [Pseudomonadales bacterium]|jgi:phage shock protein A|nr:phage shock protein PspA [Pseudomonadales bacterium]MDP6315360.1 phage shock protein PspA [Pseudomonadales bacterium]MDP7315415.1 phage shock protein PspA [Pseudomonadales bacterium]MDP7576631.1 phage shock protein PspA [Pseudomonadales bacterium]HJP49913.1 phage shock protein PspA [Pseudomonadales bacterium]|tara:strand:- start:651 stop:1346 length:696 start_codon:yes stop_codon:yes gene_type:complete
MKMGIFSRFSDIINANINVILDRAEDPEKMVRLIIQEMEETLVEVRTQSAKLIADKKELGRRTQRMKKEAESWEQKAEIALAKDREDLARAALKEKTAALEEISTVDSDLEQIDLNLQKLSGDIGLLQQKLSDAKARQKALILRGKTAKSRIGVKRQLHEVDVDAAMNRFERYERKIDVLEGEVESYDLGQRNLADEIADLESDEKVDEELARLKERMGQSTDDDSDDKDE